MTIIRIRRSYGTWRVYYKATPHAVAIYDTWERAMGYADRIVRAQARQ